MVTVKFSCKKCGVKEHPVQVPARVDEDIRVWVHNSAAICGEEHHRLSPNCTNDRCDLWIPLPPEAEFIGQQIE